MTFFFKFLSWVEGVVWGTDWAAASRPFSGERLFVRKQQQCSLRQSGQLVTICSSEPRISQIGCAISIHWRVRLGSARMENVNKFIYSNTAGTRWRYKPVGSGFDSRWCHWNIFFGIILLAPTMALGSTQPLIEMSTRNISWSGGKRRPVRRADYFTTFMCRLPRNVRDSWNPQGL